MRDLKMTSTTETNKLHHRRAYTPPRIEKRQAVARVTLLSGGGTTGVGVISMTS